MSDNDNNKSEQDGSQANVPETQDSLAVLKKTGKIVGGLYVILVIAFIFTSDSGFNWPYVFTVANCFILLLFLYLGLKTPVIKLLDEAVADTAKKLRAAREATAEAENLKRRNETLTAELEDEKKKLAAILENEKKQETERIMMQAQKEAQSIMENVKHSLDAEIQSVKAELRRELVTQALAEARKKIDAGIDDGDQERMFNAFITDLEGKHHD